jgi:hypothetical protein
MKEYQLFRNKRYEDWNKADASSELIDEMDQFFLYDPLNLGDILNIKKGSRILTFVDSNYVERIGYHELHDIILHPNFVEYQFKMMSLYGEGIFRPSYVDGIHSEMLSGVRYLAVVKDDSDPFIPIGIEGNLYQYIKILAYLTQIPEDEITVKVCALHNKKIPENLVVSGVSYFITKET